MDNRENQMMELATGEKYGIVKQFNEKDGKYFLAARITDTEDDLTGEFAFFKETEKDGEFLVEQITDEEKIKSLELNMDIPEETTEE